MGEGFWGKVSIDGGGGFGESNSSDGGVGGK